MASEWLTVPAEEFCDSVRDGTHDSPKPVPAGRFLVTSRHIVGGRLDLGNAYLISEADFDAINKRSKVDRWDVLISMIGTVGESCLINEKPDFAIKNIGLFKSKGEVEGKWLYYYLRSPDAQQRIRDLSRGTTQQYVPLGALRQFPVLVPQDHDEMRAIAYVLSVLDDKIELNRKMNDTLEMMARALFKSWFVDFDPVRAKAEGLATGLPAHIAALFPDSFDSSELGKIPTGWNATRWKDLVTLEYGKSFNGSYNCHSNQYPVYGTNGKIGSCSTPLCSFPGIIIGRKGAYRGIHYSHVPFFVIDTAFYVAPRCPIDLHWAYYSLKRHDINGMDSGSAIPSTSRQDFYSLPVIAPPQTLQRAFTETLSPVWERQIKNEQNSISLATGRDTLLPKLISGELRLHEVEQTNERHI